MCGFFKSRWRGGQGQAILPPPTLVMASTEAAAAWSASKSGQRVAGSAKVEARSKPLVAVGAVGAWMLHGDEQRLPVRREARAAHLGADRHAEEQLRRPLAARLRSPARKDRRRGRSASSRPGRSRSTAALAHRPRHCRGRRTSHFRTSPGSTTRRPRRSTGRRSAPERPRRSCRPHGRRRAASSR